MKIKATAKELRENYVIITIGFCDAYYLLSGIEPQYYTCGIYGWNSDNYIIRDNILVSTGYRPIHDYESHQNYTITRKYEEKAKKMYNNYDASKHNYNYRPLYNKIAKLREKYVEEILHHEE